jgi:hypothetical protein
MTVLSIGQQSGGGDPLRELKRYLARRVREALEVCVTRLKKDKETVNEAALFADVDAAIAEFLRSRTPHKPWD